MIRPALVPWPAVALVDVLNRIIDGADALACQGYLYDAEDDPDGAWTIPVESAAELATLIADCWECRMGPSQLAQHWLNLQQAKYVRGLPIWTCACGAVYKQLGGEFYQLGDGALLGPFCEPADRPDGDGDCWHDSCAAMIPGRDCLLGKRVGEIRTDSKGRVKDSGKCPACEVMFADTIARQQGKPLPKLPRPRPAAEPAPEPVLTLF